MLIFAWVIKMEEAEELYRSFLTKKKEISDNLKNIEKELEAEGPAQKSIVIKSIRGSLYYYTQWKEEGKLRTQYICPVGPGAAAEEEQLIQKRRMLLAAQKEQQLMLKYVEHLLADMEKDRKKQKLLENYTFEVFWKDEITARVHVQEKRVKISRFTEHPVKQLFAEKTMTRYQLNRILELRCWERERADIDEILAHLGLREYNPYEIVKKTHGVSYNDYIWFRFPGEQLTSRDVLVR